jgi:hypothetical protein
MGDFFGDGPSFLPSFLPRKHHYEENESPQFTSICAPHQKLLYRLTSTLKSNIGNRQQFPKIGPYCTYFLCCQQMSLTTVKWQRETKQKLSKGLPKQMLCQFQLNQNKHDKNGCHHNLVISLTTHQTFTFIMDGTD